MWTRSALALAALALTGCARLPVAPSAAEGYTLHTRDVYYDIDGPAAADIARQLEEHSRQNDGRLAETRWTLKSQVGFKSSATGTCRVADTAIDVDMETELPRWKGAASATPALRQQWEKFEAAARVHERGHYDHGIAAAREVVATLKGLSADDCAALNHAVTARTQAILARFEAIDARYDADTRHGILQGTVWAY